MEPLNQLSEAERLGDTSWSGAQAERRGDTSPSGARWRERPSEGFADNVDDGVLCCQE